MAQKITLSIPDLLHEKLTEWRSSFNFSKMFQDALTDAIAKKEALQKRFSEEFDMPDIVRRLRQEKLNWEKQYHAAGREEGLKWARSAHYEDLLYVQNFGNTCGKTIYELVCDDRYQTYFEEIYEIHDLGRYAMEQGADHERQFVDGWLNGVNEFWNQVKEMI